MGYKLEMLDSDLVLEHKNQKQILKIWKDLNKIENNHLKRGGSSSDGFKNQHWFSFMSPNYDKECNTVAEILELLRFEFEIDDKKNINITGFSGKAGQEDLFFKSIAHLVKPGSFVDWHGEDGLTFSWVFLENNIEQVDSSMVENMLKINQKKELLEAKIDEENTSKPKELKYKI